MSDETTNLFFRFWDCMKTTEITLQQCFIIFFIFQVVDRVKRCLDISYDPATFVQVTKTAMSFSSEIMQNDQLFHKLYMFVREQFHNSL